MKVKKLVKNYLFPFFIVFVGNFIYAVTIKFFLIPSDLVTGGATGIAITVNHYSGIPIPSFLLVFNVVMLVIGFFILGKKFFFSTVASTFIYPICLDIMDRIFGEIVLTDDIFLCTIFSGLGIGLALGMVMRVGSSTGGMDIPSVILKKLFNLPIAATVSFFDFCIILSQAFYRPVENILYGIVLTIIYTIVIDKILFLGTTRAEVKIISEKSDEICQAIHDNLDRGVTLLDGEGGYLHYELKMVLSVITDRELSRLKNIVKEIDPECFMIISQVTEVRGRGFSMKKEYQ